MKTEEILATAQLGFSPLTERVYLGISDGAGKWKAKSDFTGRLKEFAPCLFETTRSNPMYDHVFECMVCGYMGDWGTYNYCPHCGRKVEK